MKTSGIIVIATAICFTLNFVSCEDLQYISYCDCVDNANPAKANYLKIYDDYYETTDEAAANLSDTINAGLEIIRNGSNNCNLPFDHRWYIGQLLQMCGGHILDEHLVPTWRNSVENDREELCRWLVVNTPQLYAQTRRNVATIDACGYPERFNEVFLSVFKSCENIEQCC